MIDHYAILHRNEKGDYIVHISQGTKCILVEDAKTAIKKESLRGPYKTVYTGMLPKHQ